MADHRKRRLSQNNVIGPRRRPGRFALGRLTLGWLALARFVLSMMRDILPCGPEGEKANLFARHVGFSVMAFTEMSCPVQPLQGWVAT